MTTLRVLVVDDEHEKVVAISTELNKLGLPIHIESRTDAASARRLLQSERFDLVLIDVSLPDALDTGPSPMAGFDFYDLISIDDQIYIPRSILFITAKEDKLEESRAEANARGVELCEVHPASEIWRPFLAARARLVYRHVKSEGSTDVDVAVITAMRTPELSEVLALDYGWQRKRFPGDPSTYHFGVATTDGRSIKVVAVAASRKGMSASAAVAAKVATKLKPKYLVMLGICAGIPGKTNLGDVIVASSTWDWGSGKHTQDESGSVVFKTGALQSTLDPTLLEIARDVGEELEVRQKIRAGWTAAMPAGEFSVHAGPMATGASVLAHEGLVEGIVDQNRDVLGIEMEAYAVMAAAESCKCGAIVLKSVCDYADASKSDDWQKYAAYTSAMFFFRT